MPTYKHLDLVLRRTKVKNRLRYREGWSSFEDARVREQVYCQGEISIPPTFPFLLKQYAKAAIRSQPTDLLKWSTAYFVASLNIPPPVKPRLEYPIAKDFCGITPGWLKALLQQLKGSQTVNQLIY
nr:unnamed protein product [Callosobruchus analis]